MLLAAVGGGAAGAAGDGVTVAVDARLCQALISHQPAPDVAFRPGIDAAGKPVTPADLAPPLVLPVPDPFQATLSVDLAQRYGLGHAWDAELKLPVATLESRAGRLTVNGQPIGDADLQRVRAACVQGAARGKR